MKCELPNWATEIGRDRHGTWATIDIKGVTIKVRWIEPGAG